MFKNIKHIHFVGIGGSGMSGIAEVLLSLGYKVTGSDLSTSSVVKRLEELGAQVWEGHSASNIQNADVVVASTAVSKKNPEVQEAVKKGIPVIPRAEMLAELARLKYTIAIAGTHGKTTTSSLVSQILRESGLDPTVIVGGRLKAVGTGGVLGKGDYLVAEADESDGSFLKLHPTIVVLTNIDDDHLDYYKTQGNLDKAFIEFIEHVPFYGVSLICGDDPRIRKIIPNLSRRYETYGFGKNCDLRAENIKFSDSDTRFLVIYKDQKLGTITFPLAGQHNVLNALGAIGVGLKLNLTFNQISRALELYEGVGRRLEFKGMAQGIVVLDDYGHHPTEINATLGAIHDRWPGSRLHVVFQPHRYSRTKLLFKEFGASFRKVDRLFLMPIYPAGEKPIKGVTSEKIAKAIGKKNWEIWNERKSFRSLTNGLEKGDVLLTLGAGDVWKVGEDLVVRSNTLASQIVGAVPTMAKRIKTEEPLSRHCTWGIGGPAEVFAEVHTVEELIKIISICQDEKAPFMFLGWGSNVLLPDEGLRGCVIRLRGDFEKMNLSGNLIKVGAGVHLPKLSKFCAKNNLSGVESLSGVPGTVGGALITNAGTRRGVIGDVLKGVDVLTSSGERKHIPRESIETRYRWTNLSGYFILFAHLELKPSEEGQAWESIKEELDYRQKTQPLGTKNVGSVFTNPPKDHAARLIEEVGLKGKRMGQMRFSPKHANFIENLGGGTAKEALELI